MAKSDQPQKECPSCGLGVPLDANICEFCGWDFEEEDEWILEIEKLEQELMLEKQKFEGTSVEKMIRSTLRTPESVEREISHESERRTKAQKSPPRKRGKLKPSKKVDEDILEFEEEPEFAAEIEETVSLEVEDFDLPPPPDDLDAIPEIPEIPEVAKVLPKADGRKRESARTARPEKAADVKPGMPQKGKVVRVVRKKADALSGATPEGEIITTPDGRKFRRRVTRTVKAKPPSREAIKKPPETKSSGKKRVFVCPICKNQVPEDAKMCDRCGSEFE